MHSTVDETEREPQSARRVITQGVLINILNPKLTIFFFAFLPQFVPSGASHGCPHMVELSAVFMAATFVVFAAYGVLAAAVRSHVISRPRVMTWLRRVFAGSFVAWARGWRSPRDNPSGLERHTTLGCRGDDASNPPNPTIEGPVLVVGAGLIGASVAMADRAGGHRDFLRDLDSGVAHVAASRAGGSDAAPESRPQLVVIATPPDQLAREIAGALADYPAAVVTDVGSVKGRPLAELRERDIDLSRYVGGHPMAGSERSGPMASAADLFEGRTWAVVSRPDVDPR